MRRFPFRHIDTASLFLSLYLFLSAPTNRYSVLRNHRSLAIMNAKPLNAFILIDFHFNDGLRTTGTQRTHTHTPRALACNLLLITTENQKKWKKIPWKLPSNHPKHIKIVVDTNETRKVSVAIRLNERKSHFWEEGGETTKKLKITKLEF